MDKEKKKELEEQTSLKDKIVNTKYKNKYFDLEHVLNDHFIKTSQYIYDGECVRPLKYLKRIEFQEDDTKSNDDDTVGLLQMIWDYEGDCFERWYTLEAYSSRRICTSEVVIID